MQYQNAGELLPPQLLNEVRKYVPSGLLYVPRDREQPRPWGAHSGTRGYYEARNAEIRLSYEAGASVDELAESFGLSDKTIRRILYAKNEESNA